MLVQKQTSFNLPSKPRSLPNSIMFIMKMVNGLQVYNIAFTLARFWLSDENYSHTYM